MNAVMDKIYSHKKSGAKVRIASIKMSDDRRHNFVFYVEHFEKPAEPWEIRNTYILRSPEPTFLKRYELCSL